MFALNGLEEERLYRRIGTLGKSRLKLDHGLDDTIGVFRAFRGENLGLFEGRQQGHSGSDKG